MTVQHQHRNEIREYWREALSSNFVGRTEFIEQMVRDEVEQNALSAAAGDPPACPSWCELVPGHPYESSKDGAAQRYHSAMTAGEIYILQEESNTGGTATLWSDLHIYVPDLEGPVDSTRARQIAAELVEVAERFDAIVAGEL